MAGYSEDWQTLSDNYLNWLRFERNLSRNTIESYMRDVGKLRGYIEREYGILPAEVMGSHIESFMAEMYDSGIGASSQARMLSGVRSFYRFLQAESINDTTPMEFVDSPKVGRTLPDVLTVNEIDAIISTVDLSTPQGHRNKAILETLYSCGLRVSELVSLRLGDLFFDEGFIRVTGKGDKQRLVPVSTEAVKNIGIWLGQRRLMKVDQRSSEILFLNRRGRKLTRVMIFTIVKDATRAAGILKDVSPHTFRHSFATHLLEGGASIRQVQEMLGHESILTTEIYTHLDRGHLLRTLDRHHPLG